MEKFGIGEFARRSRLSIKALRLYDELGVLVPARVDGANGYRYYDVSQLDDARLIAMLRQLELPLAAVKELLACDRKEAAARIVTHWSNVESTHRERRELAKYLVNRLSGRKTVMYDVMTRAMPERSVLCLKRAVDQKGAWALGKEFIAILRERPLPKMEGREGAAFSIYWGEVNVDSDGPVEWCRPVPRANAEELASMYPELTLRIEPAHHEAYVALPNDALPATPEEEPGVQWQLASEALREWAAEQRFEPGSNPGDLGVRITYLANGPVTETSAPYRDFAVPYFPAYA